MTEPNNKLRLAALFPHPECDGMIKTQRPAQASFLGPITHFARPCNDDLNPRTGNDQALSRWIRIQRLWQNSTSKKGTNIDPMAS